MYKHLEDLILRIRLPLKNLMFAVLKLRLFEVGFKVGRPVSAQESTGSDQMHLQTVQT